jgi:hypothetical protein
MAAGSSNDAVFHTGFEHGIQKDFTNHFKSKAIQKAHHKAIDNTMDTKMPFTNRFTE